MKKLIASAILALSTTATLAGSNSDIITGIIIGAVIANQPRVIIQNPPPRVIHYPRPYHQPIYSPHPVYTNPQYYPVPRVITSSEPCHYYGQMVMTFDQFGRPIGYRNCQ